MSYSFDAFRAALGTDWFADDRLLGALVDRYATPHEGERHGLASFGAHAAGPLARLAEESARPENGPRLRPFDAWQRRIDEIVLPASTHAALGVVAGRERLGALHGDPFAFYAKTYLAHQNGEAGVACSLACTDGLTRLLAALGDRAEHRAALAALRDTRADRVVHAAQFVTEVQGGSDVGANALEAVADGDAYRLHGAKWFCSNINADWFLVSARPRGAPAGSRGVAIFLVPAYARGGDPGRNGDDAKRNGYTIDRLKDKLGTRELATAEVRFDGALAWPIGPLDRGVPNLVDHVLATSRIACVLYAAATLRQAERIVGAYAGFRTAFGRPIADYAPVRRTIDDITQARARALAVAFELVRLWPAADGTPEAAEFRVLLSLAKPVLTRRATELAHDAVLVLGANGIEERFSPLPRLYRDAAVMETWEGPHDVLLAQASRDLVRLRVDPQALAARLAGRGDDALAGMLRDALRETDAATGMRALAARAVDTLGDRVLAEVGA